jgi:hypothetical protein
MATLRIALISVVLVLGASSMTACGSAAVEEDAGASVDAAAAVRDGGTESDGGRPEDDAGAEVDGAVPVDGGEALDGATAGDAAASDDAGALMAEDGGADAGATIDAGAALDAGPADAGVAIDAGPTTCGLSVAPPTGTEADDFTFTPTTNGSGCSGTVGGLTIPVDCASPLTLSGSTFGVGVHTVVLSVAEGPGGPTSCTAMFEVEAAGATTCFISVTPMSGPASTTFTADFESNGSGCSLSFDGLGLGMVDCTGSYSSSADLIGVGMHTVTLRVADGPDGPRDCEATFTVTAS